VFRRHGSDAPEVLDSEPGFTAETAEDDEPFRPGYTPKKGAPTPKRSEAESNRRQPYVAPADRKAASQASRDRNRQDRMRRADALQRGEDWALPAKDKGPVRALARDVVDARQGIAEYYMFSLIPLFVLLIVPNQTAKLAAEFLVLAIIVVAIAEGSLVTSRVKRLISDRLPGERTNGLWVYVTMRSISLRRMRMPKPRVNRGDPV
jgi:hypothetical protein